MVEFVGKDEDGQPEDLPSWTTELMKRPNEWALVYAANSRDKANEFNIVAQNRLGENFVVCDISHVETTVTYRVYAMYTGLPLVIPEDTKSSEDAQSGVINASDFYKCNPIPQIAS